MYDEAIEWLMKDEPQLAIDSIERVMNEQSLLLKNRLTNEEQEELEFDNPMDFMPPHGWEAA